MKTKKGFTLIELMVAMGIIAVLVTMSVVAIQIVQRSLRDTQRRDVLNTVNLWLYDYYNANNRFPADGQISFTDTAVLFDGTETIRDLSGATTNASSSDATGTAYCYFTTTGGTFQLGALLEGGSTVQLGNDESAGCDPTTED